VAFFILKLCKPVNNLPGFLVFVGLNRNILIHRPQMQIPLRKLNFDSVFFQNIKYGEKHFAADMFAFNKIRKTVLLFQNKNSEQ
jgi:hypothetical protein